MFSRGSARVQYFTDIETVLVFNISGFTVVRNSKICPIKLTRSLHGFKLKEAVTILLSEFGF